MISMAKATMMTNARKANIQNKNVFISILK
jgi:hypothetical protein